MKGTFLWKIATLQPIAWLKKCTMVGFVGTLWNLFRLSISPLFSFFFQYLIELHILLPSINSTFQFYKKLVCYEQFMFFLVFLKVHDFVWVLSCRAFQRSCSCYPIWDEYLVRYLQNICFAGISGHLRKMGPKTQDFWWDLRPDTRDPSYGWEPGPEARDLRPETYS